MITKNCAICGKILGRKTLYTCADCKGIWQTKPKEERICSRPECETIFLVGGNNTKNKKYCSNSCAAKVNNIGRIMSKKPSKLCKECNKPLKNRARTYCSYSCQYSISNRKKLASKTKSQIITINGLIRGQSIADVSIELLSHDTRRTRVIEEQNHKCNGCKIDTWRGKPIILELEHKDGNNKNNIRENLEALCPNCHSQTETWRGRNKARKATDEEMIAAIKATTSLRKALEMLGMAAKGGNYKRISKLAFG